ncbi:zonular occludens toxin domain-containing protein [Paraburkholderia ferrariae]|uniref:Zonular occludens toxin domain-containing protein n=1 Tax=Paraburkholderia ferrariae TaxID=386056 RepID=A0ABU9S2E6_9BURK
MAINAYCGVMGSGKSYEVVSGPLLDAVAAGRRVVTNIDGINEKAIHEYLCKRRGLEREEFGRVVMVATQDFLKPGFFPTEVEGSEGAVVTPGFVEAGDFVVVDEAWKLWKTGTKITPEHMAFFRMHRHFVHAETGVACDVVLMIQAISGLHRDLRDVIELSFVMVKLKSLGLSKGYRVEMYETAKQNNRTRTGTFVRKYKAEIFPLYRSYAGGKGSESTVDRRQNILANKRLWLLVAGIGVMCLVSVRLLVAFFHPKGHVSQNTAAQTGLQGSSSAPPPTNGSQSTGGGSKPSYSENWRIVGGYSSGNVGWVIVADNAGRLRVDSPSNYQNYGAAQVGQLDGETVTTFSGKESAPVAIGAPVGLGGAK